MIGKEVFLRFNRLSDDDMMRGYVREVTPLFIRLETGLPGYDRTPLRTFYIPWSAVASIQILQQGDTDAAQDQ